MLSHLEVCHALERMVRRAKLPFALTQGFSPHMRIAFGSALPVGVGGSHELFDVILTDYLAPEKALAALSANAPRHLMPQACTYVEPKAKACSVAFPYSVYEACFPCAVPHLTIPSEIEVQRKKKAKTLQVRDFLVGEPCVRDQKLVFQLEAKPTGSLRADVFLRACLPSAEWVSLTRVAQASSPVEV